MVLVYKRWGGASTAAASAPSGAAAAAAAAAAVAREGAKRVGLFDETPHVTELLRRARDRPTMAHLLRLLCVLCERCVGDGGRWTVAVTVTVTVTAAV
jgi:hypothetical protein